MWKSRSKFVLIIIVLLGLFVGSELMAQKPGKPAWPPSDEFKMGPPPPPTPIDTVSWILIIGGGLLGAYLYVSNSSKSKSPVEV